MEGVSNEITDSESYMDSPDLKARMEAAGITEMGQMLILEEMYSGKYPTES